MIPLLETRGIDVDIGEHRVCRGLDLQLSAGNILAILGRNGVGKSTLLTTLAGLREPAAGAILLEGSPLAELSPKRIAQIRAYLPQQIHDPFASTVLETALIGRHPHLGRWDWESAADRRLAQDALVAVELGGLEERSVHTLSGGERQRLGLAMLLVQSPRLYLLDEPLAHLDPHHGLSALKLLRERASTAGAAVVVVLHDANLALRYCDSALLLYGDGESCLGPVAEILNADNLSRLYGHPLRALDEAGRPWFVPAIPPDRP
jgi:iron complex transport system ATP-binding protein